MWSDDVLVVPDFGTEADVSALLVAFDAAILTGGFSVPPRAPRIQIPCWEIDSACEPQRFEQIVDIRKRMLATMQHVFQTPALPDLTLLSEMRAGDSHPLHADAEQETPDGWKPNHSSWRTHVGILYLNTYGVDYAGGALRLPSIDRVIVPTTGMFVAFPSGRRHAHEVTEVTEGLRRTLAMWLTTDPARVDLLDTQCLGTHTPRHLGEEQLNDRLLYG